MDDLQNGTPQSAGTESNGSRAARTDGTQVQQRRPRAWGWLLGVAGAAAVISGAALLHVGENVGMAATDPPRVSSNGTPNTLRFDGSVVRVLVNARLGTVLVDLSTSTPEPSGTPSSAANHAGTADVYRVGVSSDAPATCTPDAAGRSVRLSNLPR